MKLFVSQLFLLFVDGTLSQRVRFPNRDSRYGGRSPCQRDSTCIDIIRCPPARRVRNAPQCFNNGGYYRRNSGVCCRNTEWPINPPNRSPGLIPAPANVFDSFEGVRFPNGDSRTRYSQPVPGNEQCLRGSRCLAWNRCPPSRRPRTRTAPCFYEGYSRRNPGVCCADIRRGLSADIPPALVTTSTTTTASPMNPQNGDCGRSLSTSGLMIGGSPARPGVWPWMVAITKAERNGIRTPWCTGSLIDRTHVLTAAHCFDDRDLTLYTLRIGNVDQRLGDAYNIRRLAIPDSNRIGRFYSDIAVLTLDRAVNTPDFMPICLPDSVFRNFTGIGVSLAGWGSTSPGGPTTNILQQLIAMPVLSNYECDSIFRSRMNDFGRLFPNGFNTDFICAGFLEGGRDSCGGDSGGPMMIAEGGRWYQIGIVSFGHARCATPGFPAGYTRVSTFIDFILGNL